VFMPDIDDASKGKSPAPVVGVTGRGVTRPR
jgi:hypothetical protein